MQKIDLNSPQIVRAARLMTMAPGDSLLPSGAILSDGITIHDVGTFADLAHAWPNATVTDLGDATLVPGLINAHCHLELSAMRGGIEPGLGFMGWLMQLIGHPKRPFSREHVQEAISEMRRSGTCFVGDISTHNTEAVAGVLDDSGFFFACFREHLLFELPEEDSELIPSGSFAHGFYSAAGHAPYSTHPKLLRMIKNATRKQGRPYSLHLAENFEETEALLGTNNWYTDQLDNIGISHDGLTPPLCGPVKYAHDLGLLDSSTLAVHCVTVSDDDISILAETGTNVCLCPRSNEFITGGCAPWEKLLAAGVNCCLGTDSLASNYDLNLWNELRFMKERYDGELSLEQGVALMTRNSARALGLGGLGMLSPGMAAQYATIPTDIEEMFAKS